MNITTTETDPLKIKRILKVSKIILFCLPFVSLFSLIITGLPAFIFDIVFYLIIAFVAVYAKNKMVATIAVVLSVIELIFVIISILVITSPIITLLFPIIAIDRTIKLKKYKFASPKIAN